jgi:oligopeptide/dipeptide ABC transporter ATP-binding protein
MYLGRIVELAAADELYGMARHPYTQALLSAMPELDADPLAEGDPEELQGEPPSPHDPPSGCHFHPRCPRCQARCMAEPPVLAQAPGSAAGHQVACHFPNSTAGQSA